MHKNIRMYLLIGVFLFAGISLYLWIFDSGSPQKNIDSRQDKVTSIVPDPPQVIEKVETNLPYEISNVEVQLAELKGNFVAPSFMNNEIIIFSLDDINTGKSQIIEYDVAGKHSSIRYTAANGKTVTSLVATDIDLIWVEYDLKQNIDRKWEIKKMSITGKDSKAVILKKGESRDQMNPPVIRVMNGMASWIEKRLDKKIVQSDAIVYDSHSGESKVVASAFLDERNRIRKGTFLDIHRHIEDGLLIQQSEFKQDGNKTFNLVYYPFDGEDPEILMHNSENLVDFTANDKWLVLTQEGKVTVISRKNKEVKYVSRNEDEKVTNDSPFLVDDHLLFRSFTDQIIDMDLKTGEKRTLSEQRSITSKLFNSGDYIGASYMDVLKGDGSAEFMMFHSK